LVVISPDVPAHSIVTGAAPLDDGRVLLLGSQDLQPGTPRQDGADVESVASPLTVVSSSGAVESTRDVRMRGEAVRLVGATASNALLARASASSKTVRLTSLDLTTGAEKVVGSLPDLPSVADVGADQLVTSSHRDARQVSSCVVTDMSLVTLTSTSAPIEGCGQVVGVRVNGAGNRVAIVFVSLKSARVDLRLAVWNLETGVVAPSATLGRTVPYGDPATVCGDGCSSETPVDLAGIAWNEDAVRVALIRHPASGRLDDVRLPGSVEVTTVPG
jgi:hypothetical protein